MSNSGHARKWRDKDNSRRPHRSISRNLGSYAGPQRLPDQGYRLTREQSMYGRVEMLGVCYDGGLCGSALARGVPRVFGQDKPVSSCKKPAREHGAVNPVTSVTVEKDSCSESRGGRLQDNCIEARKYSGLAPKAFVYLSRELGLR